MANQEHLDILKQGVEVWNAWRREYWNVQPILTRVDFQGVDLSGAFLRWADLRESHLRGSDLRKANLFRADLFWADLREVDLRNANIGGAFLRGVDLRKANLGEAFLRGADLFSANLEGANLARADLRGANLEAVSLSEANFEGAKLDNTKFLNTNLSCARNLDICIHMGTCPIDYLTIKKSAPLPRTFLQGVGIREELIEAYISDLADTLTIVFTSSRWGQLTPIEYALSATLGKRYIVEQSADRIVVKLDSPEQFQATLDAVVPVLAALESAEPGEVERLSMNPKEGDEEVLEGVEMRF